MNYSFEVARLGDFCIKVGSGATPKGGKEVYLETGEFSLIRSQNVLNNQFSYNGLAYITEKAAEKLNGVSVESGDVLLNITGDSVARCCSAPPFVLPARVNQHVAIVRSDPAELLPLFVRYFLVSPIQQDHMLKLASSGATRNALTKGMIEDFSIPKPDIDIQRVIAKMLGDLDDKIELLREMNQTLEDIARAVFQAWFVDFEPVRAKAEGASSFQGMPQDLFDTLPDKFEPSENGEIPAGWKVERLSSIVEHPRRAANPNEIDSTTPYIGLEHMPRRSITLGEWETAEKVSSNKHRFERHEILYGKLRPNFHKVGVVFVDGVCSTDIVVLRPLREEFFGVALACASSDNFVAHNVVASDGTKMPRTNWEIIGRYEFCLPPLDAPIVSYFDEFIRSIVNKLEANVFESSTLASLRDTLLPKLISGELEAPSLEALGLEGRK